MPGVIVHRDLASYSRWAEKLGREFMGAVQRGTISGAARCITIMQRRTREARPANPGGKGQGGAVNTGGYLGGWRSTALAPIGAVVFNGKLHAAIVELGRRKGVFPPLDVIARWAQRRLGLSRKESLHAAYPIGRAIARRGLLPRYVMADGVGEMARIVDEEMARELDAAMQQSAG